MTPYPNPKFFEYQFIDQMLINILIWFYLVLHISFTEETFDSCCTNDHTHDENREESADKTNVLMFGMYVLK